MPGVAHGAQQRAGERAGADAGLEHPGAGEDVGDADDLGGVLGVDHRGAARHRQHEVGQQRPQRQVGAPRRSRSPRCPRAARSGRRARRTPLWVWNTLPGAQRDRVHPPLGVGELDAVAGCERSAGGGGGLGVDGHGGRGYAGRPAPVAQPSGQRRPARASTSAVESTPYDPARRRRRRGTPRRRRRVPRTRSWPSQVDGQRRAGLEPRTAPPTRAPRAALRGRGHRGLGARCHGRPRRRRPPGRRRPSPAARRSASASGDVGHGRDEDAPGERSPAAARAMPLAQAGPSAAPGVAPRPDERQRSGPPSSSREDDGLPAAEGGDANGSATTSSASAASDPGRHAGARAGSRPVAAQTAARSSRPPSSGRPGSRLKTPTNRLATASCSSRT